MFRKAARGFTLIELMIVVAIIGILAAIAIPNFLKYQLRTKRSEGSINVAGIRTSEISYYGSYDKYIAAGPLPTAYGGQQKQKWTCATEECTGFGTIAWKPEGDVYFKYQVFTDANGTGFTATALGDLDGDGNESCWAYYKLPVAADPTTDPEPVTSGVPRPCQGLGEDDESGDATYKTDQTYLATLEAVY